LGEGEECFGVIALGPVSPVVVLAQGKVLETLSLDHGRVPGQTKMQVELKHRCRGNQVLSYGASARDLRIERLIDRLPRCFRPTIHWLRQPSSLWIRIPAGVLLTCGGLFGFLPVLEPIREVWIHDEGFAASRLSMMRIMASRTNAATVMA
jgi:hypothetical protein